MQQLQNFLMTLKAFLGFIQCDCVTISAAGWVAVYQQQKRIPLVAWEITYIEDTPVFSKGLVFQDIPAHYLKYAEDLPDFIGYEPQNIQYSSFSIPDAYQRLGEWKD